MFTDREVIDAIRRMRKVGSDTQAWEVKEAVPYNAVNEAALCVFPDERNELILRPGFFTLYFTDDAHAPQLAVDSPGIVRKVVVKAAAAGFQNDPL